MSLEYRVQGEAFGFDALSCLRNEYAHNDCRECLQICPVEAFGFDRGRFGVDLQKCINCGVCLGVCPTGALGLAFFDPDGYVETLEEEEVSLSCKKDLPCLSVFDVHHFASMLLDHREVACDLSHCEGCELNPGGRTLDSIRTRMEKAREFVKALGVEREFESRPYEPDRRAFFKTVFDGARKLTGGKRSEETGSGGGVPKKVELLKRSVREYATDLAKPHVEAEFLADKEIDAGCDNCGECVQFCPTQALFFAKEGRAIWFVSGKCIACGICHEVCEPKAIHGSHRVDILSWAFDRGRELIEHTFEICRECKTPFAYKGGEPICGRCKGFVDRFGDIFRLACEE